MPLFGRPSQQDNLRAQAWRDWLLQRNPYAIASFILSLFSLIEFGVLIIFGLVGIVLGIIALRQLRAPSPSRPLGHRLAYGGIILSAISLIIAAVLYRLR